MPSPMSLFCFIFCSSAFFCTYYPQFSSGLSYENMTEYNALLNIKAKIRQDPLGVTSSWNNTLHFCDWHGITCGHTHKRVIALDLSSSQLSGYLSPFMGNLSFLKKLDLYNNSFVGPIPPEIDRLQRLRYLRLLNNSLGGQIPSNISSCRNLVLLALGNSGLIGRIPPELGSLSQLQFLSLDFNNLSGSIPSSFGNLSSIHTLSICRSNVVGKIPDSLGNLFNVNYLSLCANYLSGEFPPSIFNLSSLRALDVGFNQLEGTLTVNLGNVLSNLSGFYISMNHFTGSIPASLSNSSSLEDIQLSDNNLQGQVPSLHKLGKLRNLLLSKNLLGSGLTTDLNFVYSLPNYTMLQELDITQNNFKGVFPQVFCNFSRLTALDIGFNKLSGQIPTCIKDLENLVRFQAAGCKLSGLIPESIGNLKNLYYFEFNINRLSGRLPSSIGNLTNLGILELDGNNLEGEIPSTLQNCKALQRLHLAGNNFSGKIPSQIFTLSSLSIALDLSHNRLIGPLPIEVGKLTQLDALDISQNMLSGEIPSTLSACVSLEFLYMGGNLFQGEIPSSLKALMGLQDLNLSHNNLSGKIPDFLVKIKFQNLDLSYNKLEGEVPVGGIFNNATGVSLFGNSRLCGGIAELKLPRCNFNIAHKRRLSHKVRLIIISLSVLFGVALLVTFALLYVFYGRKRKEIPNTKSQDVGNTISNLSYQSLSKATNGFTRENVIGSGAFGVVYKGIYDQDVTPIAIKIFNLEQKGASKSFMAECEVLRNIRHRNLVKVITACSSIDYQGRDFKALVYEYMVNGSLEEWLHPQPSNSIESSSSTPRNLNFSQRLDIAVDVASALEYLHHGFGDHVVHCDLKPSNVLLDDEMVAHVGDFGLAKILPNGSANQSSSIGIRGTVGYAPPEYGLGNELSKEGDVYSFGILLLEMFTGKKPTDDMFKEGFSLHKYVKEALSEQVIGIIDKALLEDITGAGTITVDMNSEIHSSKKILEALSSVLGIALSCSAELREERMDTRDVAAKLISIRNKLVGTDLRTRRRAS